MAGIEGSDEPTGAATEAVTAEPAAGVEGADEPTGSDEPTAADAPGEGTTTTAVPPTTPAPAVEAGPAAPATEVTASDRRPPDGSAAAPDVPVDADGSGSGAGTEAEATAPAEPAPPVRERRTISREVARLLYEAGARTCFTVPGESFLPVLDDLRAVGIRVVTTRHESGAAFMAEALAQSTGRPQIVLVTRAVGASNAAIGIHTAAQDSAPLVALVGQVRTADRGREAFQEADLVGGIGALASWAAEIDGPDRADATLRELWSRLTIGRPGPVLLSLPEDVQEQEFDADIAERRQPGARGPAADRGSVSRILKWLAASERGVIVAGAGVLRSRSTKRLISVAEALAVPVMAAWRRPDVFPNDHANYLGMTGYWAAATVKPRLADADVILFLGTRLNEVTTFGYEIPGPDTRWAHVDVKPRGRGAGLGAPPIAVAADASRFLDSAWSDLRSVALDNEMRDRRVARLAADRAAYRAASDVGQGSYGGPGVHPGRIVTMLRAMLPDNATITTDAGNFAGWVARGFRFRRAGTFIGPTSGAMGYGLPAAIASSLQDPDRIAVSVSGDGGFAMTMNELETSVREGAHPIALVFDNRRYGTIAMHQRRAGRDTGTSELGALDIAGIARASGALGFDVTSDDGFEDAMREAITSRRTSVIRLELDPAWVSTDEHPPLEP